MNKNSTLRICYMAILIILTFTTTSLKAQEDTLPKLKFSGPKLVSGTAGQVNATYKFSDVTTGVDAFISIENMVNGAYLVNIDDSVLGYYNAWQPTVGGNGNYGSSYIKWDIKFKDKTGGKFVFPKLAATAIDIDGDNARVREFIGVNGQSSYFTPTQTPTLLTISNPTVTDNIYNTDAAATNLIALGPVANRLDIDTSTQDVRLNFGFIDMSEFKLYTGEQVDNNGNTGGIATSRYHCIYFQNIISTYKVLPVSYQSFNAVLNNNAVNLFWTTNLETYNDHFEVERSFDQLNFSTAGIILGAQSVKNGANQYSFKDNGNDLSKYNTIYYRLKQVDADGHFTYSVIKIVHLGNLHNSTIALQVSPNPYLDKLNINFQSNNDGRAEVTMISASGTVVKKAGTTIRKGLNNVQLQDLSNQLPGIYMVSIVVNGELIGSQKIIKH